MFHKDEKLFRLHHFLEYADIRKTSTCGMYEYMRVGLNFDNWLDDTVEDRKNKTELQEWQRNYTIADWRNEWDVVRKKGPWGCSSLHDGLSSFMRKDG